jgi:HK97 family phage major capsid protein
MRTLQEIQARRAEIRSMLEAPDADLEALERELDELDVEERAYTEAVERRSRLEKRVVGAPASAVVRSFPTPQPGEAEERFDASSPEYRAAFLKNLAKDRKTGAMRLGELTDVEQRAFTYLTSNTTAVLPTTMSTKIWDMVSDRCALYAHIGKSSFKSAYQFDQATAITAGDAAVTAQNTANSDDLTITFNPTTLTGVEIRADVEIGRKMQIQSMDGFEDYLVRKLSERISTKLNVQLFADLVADRLEANAIATAGALAKADFLSALGKLRGGIDCRVYANQTTIWTQIAAVEDLNGRAYFIPSELDSDPTLQGRIFGKKVYLDDTLADNVIHFILVDTVEANLFQDIEVLSDVDAKTHATTYGGLAIFEAAMGDTRGIVTVTVTEAVS